MRHALRRLTIGMALLLSFAAPSPHADADPAAGLIGYWPFDGSGEDLSGNSLALTLEGGAGFNAGLFGQALDLQNTAVAGGQFATRASDDPAFDFGSSDFTVQAWVNFTDLSREEVVVEKFGGPAGPGWTLTKLITGAWELYATTTGTPLIVTSGPQRIDLNVWHHIVVRRAGSLFELIFDGAVVGSQQSNQPLTASGTPLLVGRRVPLDRRNFAVAGRIDDVAIWGRALGDDEIAFLFNGGRGAPVIVLAPPNTVAVLSPQANADGWNNGPVEVTLTATDDPNGPGVKEIHLALSGAQVGASVVSGSTATVPITAEGTTTLTYYSVDNAGNVEPPKIISISIDNTPPVVTCSVTPSVLWPPDGKMVAVTAKVTVADSLSGSAGFVLSSVLSSQPGPGQMEGFVVGTASTSGFLQAARRKAHTGRIYTFTFSGLDRAGNSTSCVSRVTVPYHRRTELGTTGDSDHRIEGWGARRHHHREIRSDRDCDDIPAGSSACLKDRRRSP